MAKTCGACGGAVCEVCGGCIAQGECSCMEDRIADYDKQIKEAREEIDRLREIEKKYLAISGLVSDRHGDDGVYEQPEDEYGDDPETITIKRIFEILEGGEG